ncbi:hypothetical protein [Arcanobacterium buesumense]|uniref:CobQ/CobB/MinD/ParA nucleotide binding domain-containing protein n=1 Tax=Arcanobacterium buesumense TaxID=2722751 RepID=A0A6H2EN80_9ACTO|nr:hypothetical protein [Arcanobacterium buesumense]QJC22533.1 hypothetical protein HC352_08475 [Arcanobacterium buesumense]
MKTTTSRDLTELELISVLYRGNDERIGCELQRLAQLVGLDFRCVDYSDRSVDGVLTFQSRGLPPSIVQARFHDMFASYFAKGVAQFHVRDDASDLLALMSSVGTTVRGTVVGIVGAHGGAGTTTVAAWLARMAARDGTPIALADLNPAGDSWQEFLGIDSGGTTRADIFAMPGTLLPGKLAQSLSLWHGVRVLPSSGLVIEQKVQSASAVVAALSQVHAWTFVDMGVVGMDWRAQHEWLEWCDELVMVTGANTVNIANCQHKYRLISQRLRPIVVANAVRSKLEADHVAVALGESDVFGVRAMRSARYENDYGVEPGDRRVGGAVKDMKNLWNVLREQVA